MTFDKSTTEFVFSSSTDAKPLSWLLHFGAGILKANLFVYEWTLSCIFEWLDVIEFGLAVVYATGLLIVPVNELALFPGL